MYYIIYMQLLQLLHATPQYKASKCQKHRQWQIGLTENAGHENDGPSKLQDVKLQDMKLTDRFWRHLQGMKLQDMKTTDQICRA